MNEMPKSFPAEIQPYSTGSANPHEVLTEVISPTQAACIRGQLRELLKVADDAGGPSTLIDRMNRRKVVFQIVSNDTTHGPPSSLSPGIHSALENPGLRLVYRITNLVVIDPKSHKPECQNLTSDQIEKWLKDDISHTVTFPVVAPKHSGPHPDGSRAI